MPQVGYLPRQNALISGVVAPGAVLRFYRTGTATPQSAYTDSALSNAVTSLTADSAGVFAKWYLNPAAVADYRYTLETASGSVYYTEDNIDRLSTTRSDVGRTLYPLSDAENAASITPSDYGYAWGDIRRYGASTAASNNATAIQAAINVFAQGGPAVYIPSGSWAITTALTCVEGLNVYGDGRLKSEVLLSGAIKGFVYQPSSLTDAALVFQDFKVRGTSSALELFDLSNVILCEFRDMQIRSTGQSCIRLQNECDSIKFYGGLLESWTDAAVEMTGAVCSLIHFHGTQFNVNNDITSNGAAILITGGGENLTIDSCNLNGNARPTPLLHVSSASYSRICIRNTYAEGSTSSIVSATGTAVIRHLEIIGGNFSTTNSIRVDLANSQAHQGIRISGLRSPDTAAGSVFNPGSTTDFEYEGADISGSLSHVTGWSSDRFISYRSTRIRGQRTLLGPFTQANVSASQTDVALGGTRVCMPRTGSVTGIVVKSNEARSGGTATFSVRLNSGLSGGAGSDTGLTAILNATNTGFAASTQGPNADTFSAGDELWVAITTDGSWAPTTADVQAFIEVEM